MYRNESVCDPSRGEEERLFYIPEWNFDWQDDYRFATPIALPRGTEVRLHYRYDNTEQNVRNPNHPPRRVTYGEKSSDSMADLLLYFRLNGNDDLEVLQNDYLKFQFRLSLARHLWELEQNPDDPNELILVGEAMDPIGPVRRSSPLF